jgi:predicted PurR-regulated permease PerM
MKIKLPKHPLAILLVVLVIGGATFVIYSIVTTIWSNIKSGENFISGIFSGISDDATALWNSVTGFLPSPAQAAADLSSVVTLSGAPISATTAAAFEAGISNPNLSLPPSGVPSFGSTDFSTFVSGL